mmetsp:Transcript_22365/g.38237  ORF Transcript_22365/g.38237 Transcript_22365/m.38237 type:complete len:142 (-) Transcript_22365:41-466(-)
MIDFQSISPASAPVTTRSRRRCCPSILWWSNESAELLMVSSLIGEPTATDDTSVSSLSGEDDGDRGRCDDADAVDIGDTHAVVATDEFDVDGAFFDGEMRHRSSPLPLGDRCDDDLCMQLPMMTRSRPLPAPTKFDIFLAT